MTVPADIEPSADAIELAALRGRFEAMVFDWALSPPEVAALLCLPMADCARMGRARSLPIDVETRMRRAVQVDGLMRLLLGDVDDCARWLRLPNPGIFGNLRPLRVMCDGDAGLRGLRDALRAEAAGAGLGAAW